jgi:hypothetical protein
MRGWMVSRVDRAPGVVIKRCRNCSIYDDDDQARNAAAAEIFSTLERCV